MSTVYVQFSDSTKTKVVAVFGCPQDATAFPNQGAIDATDARYQAFVNPASTLTGAQAAQNAVIDSTYASAVQQSVTFKTAAGVTETFQADADSQTILMQATQGYQIAGATPSGFYWKSADNTQVAFTLADLQGLYTAILAQGWTAFQKRTTLKTQISAATTVAAVQAVNW
ncbi:DUF4376 domain-containing protein [Paraburkholderia sp. Cpub6]|uniref:DUF4376 domain-containing protein n=1 Tax=Paraburkholderia sp. Cpub6 TaxID=2723094 RepID=UPI00160E05BB|nr:DUF4376 domain-containing protein [Paraburkholderia sp. Cpub6]MBB5462864.1 hypothetical protein [Paraburkholderia sp. Cpub6]